MLIQIFAHAGEEHSGTLEALNHSLPWYVAVPIFFIVVAMIGYLTWLVSGKKLDTTLLVIALVLLISGFTLFNISAAISVISLTVGIVLAGALAFLGIAGENTKK